MTTNNPEAQPQPNQQQQQPQPTSGKRIIVRNLPPGTTREELRELGDRYGRVINVELVSKPDRPCFGFISFLTEDDAAFSIYRLHDYRYKGNLLGASLSNNNPPPKQKPNQRAKDDFKPKKPKKPMYSLRSLTPLNPPSVPPQQAQGHNSQSPKSWDNPVAAQAAPSNQPADNGYLQGSKGNAGKQQGKRNNNLNNRSRGKQQQSYKQAVPHEIADDVPTESAPDNYLNSDVNDVPLTDVHITIEASQIWWLLKLSPEQLQDFYKAVEPFVPVSQ